MHIGVVAGETSGDALAAGLIGALQQQRPDVRISGIGGPKMSSLGAENLYPMERISIMGLDGLMENLPAILKIRRHVKQHFNHQQIDAFVGVDVPDFNLGLELALRRQGIPTIHYVSPTVWAWRGYRIHKIRRAVDHMLTLFPFEASFYKQHDVPVTCVGHPMADAIPNSDQTSEARSALELNTNQKIIALLPGSRVREIEKMGLLFVEAAARLHQQQPGIHFLVPMASMETRQAFEKLCGEHCKDLSFDVLDGDAHQAIAASDAILVASGTAALETLLFGKPMVVAYRVSTMSYWFVRCFSQVKHYSMPNHLLPSPMVPEFIQNDATPDALANSLLDYLNNPHKVSELQHEFSKVHEQLHGGGSELAAKAVLSTMTASD